MVVQVPTVWTLLDVAVLGEVLHPNPHVYHRLPAVLTVQAGLTTGRGGQDVIGIHGAQLVPAAVPPRLTLDADDLVNPFQAIHAYRVQVHESPLEVTGNIVFDLIVSGRAQKQSAVHQRELLEHRQRTVAQGTVYNISVAGTEGREDELPQILALSHLRIVFHPNVESVQLMPGDVSEQLGEVQPPQELHGRVKVAPPVNRQPSRAVIKVGVSEHVPPGQGLFVRLKVDGVL